MWSFTPSEANIFLFEKLKQAFEEEDLTINRSSIINRALDQMFGRMTKTEIKELIKTEWESNGCI